MRCTIQEGILNDLANVTFFVFVLLEFEPTIFFALPCI